MWLSRVENMVLDGRRSPSTLELPASVEEPCAAGDGVVRLAVATTPLVDKVIASIKQTVGAHTAKNCRTVISEPMGLAVRYGAIITNPRP